MRRVLLVEDDAIIANIYSNKLRIESFEVQIARDGQMGLEMVESFNPDLIVLDLMLPKLTGVEVIKALRAKENHKSLPIIVFSNSYLSSLVQEAWKAGATKCLSKADSTPKNLIDLIRNVLAAPTAASPPPAPVSGIAGAAPLGSAQTTNPSLEVPTDDTFLVTKAVEADSGYQAGIRKSFVDTAPAALAGIRGVLMTYSKTEDPAEKLSHLNDLYRKVHSLAESAGVAGMKQVSIMGSALEALLREVCEKPKTINPSVLRTIASAIDFLGQLFTASVAGEWDFEQPNILVLDDEIISRRAVIYALEKIKLRGLSVADPNIALTLLQDNKFDLIFLDVDLGSMSGFDVCTLLRTFPNHAKTPVIFVTGASDFASRAKSTLSGGTDLIAKPFLFMELAVKALTQVLRKKSPPPTLG